MHDRAGGPDGNRHHIGRLGADLVDKPPGKQHGNRINELEHRSDVGVIGVAPAKLRRQLRRQEAEHLAVEVIDGGGKEQHRADGPAIVADGLADAVGVDGLIQIHGITFYFC